MALICDGPAGSIRALMPLRSKQGGPPLGGPPEIMWTVHPPSNEPSRRNERSLLGSDDLRHAGSVVYRCFLPDLTGLQEPAAQGPAVNATYAPHVPERRALGREFDPLERIAVQGTASSPSSTITH